jgi:hypothetical protein
MLLGTATAPQLLLDSNPNRHGPRLVDHAFDEADVIPPAPSSAKIWAVGEPEGRVFEGEGRVAKGVGRRILVGVRTEKEVGELFERGQTMLLENRQSGFPKLVPGVLLPMLLCARALSLA